MADFTSPSRPTFVDLFCGCGGLSLGFLEAGFDGLLALDADPRVVDVYNRNLKGHRDRGALVCDLSQFTSRQEVKSFLDSHGIESCDVLIGGPPCQSFSVAGINKTRALAKASDDMARQWDEKHQQRVNLFEVYALFLEVLKPRWFLFENVPSIRSHSVFRILVERFSTLHDEGGHKLIYGFDAECPNTLASRYGVPQNRWRFLMVGERLDSPGAMPSRHGPIQQPAVSVAEALDDLPEISHGHRETHTPYCSAPKNRYQRLMRLRGPYGQRANQVAEHICRKHNGDDVALFERMGPGAKFADSAVQIAMRAINPEHHLAKYATDKFQDKLHRLDPDRPAWTVTAHLSRDCYKFIHHRQARTISVREAARLQSFPDWFSFAGLGLNAAFAMIGNAVPPLLARQFARTMTVGRVKRTMSELVDAQPRLLAAD